MFKSICLFIVLGALAESAAASTWFTSKIKRVYPLGSGEVVIVFTNNSPACTNNDQYHRISSGANGMTKEGVDKIYSLALTAASTNKKMTINFDETSSLCYINRAYVVFN